jgi:hypothetical protein
MALRSLRSSASQHNLQGKNKENEFGQRRNLLFACMQQVLGIEHPP